MNFHFHKIIKRDTLKKKLKKLQLIARHKHHPLIHHIHHIHKISKKTLFYIKEYGAHSNVPKTILKESIKIIILASLVSSLGGFALEEVKTIFISIMPLVILLPTLNDMIGDYGTIVSSRFSTMLHKREITKLWWKNLIVQQLLTQIFIIASITAVLSACTALGVTYFVEHSVNPVVAAKILVITLLDVLIIVALLCVLSIYAGLYYFKKEKDPNNFLIPITTSVADFGNMIVLTGLVLLFF
ncbi:MAG: magnesium transporter [Candidatus Woesearchaeota archaeon]|jgi:cation transporter-like permease